MLARTKTENETSVFFSISEDTLKEFNEAIKKKSKKIGIELNKKQAYALAIKEAIDNWSKKDTNNVIS